MMRGKSPLVISVVLGLVAALMAYYTMKHKEDALKERFTVKPIVVVSQDLEPGTEIDASMLAKMDAPVEFHTSSVVKPEQVERVLGQRILVGLKRGDPLMWNHFYSVSQQRLSDILRNRGRAISLDFSGAKGVAGMVHPADHVDILGTFQDLKDNQLVTVTLMQNVVVLATDTRTGSASLPKEDSGYTTVTLAVHPEEAEILALAEELGTLRLTLRGSSDIGMLEDREKASLHTLLTGERLKEAKDLRRKLPDLIYLDKSKAR